MPEKEYKTTAAQRKAAAKYKKNNIKNYNFQVNKTKDKIIVDHLESKPNKADYIKSLIREDIKNNKLSQ